MGSIAERADRAWLALSPARRSVFAWMLLAVATLPVLSRLVIGGTAGDVRVFLGGVEAFLHGNLVYRDVAFEYPPYALLWFLLPHAVSHDVDGFRLAFGLEMWVLDAAIKGVLLWRGVRAGAGIRDLAPFFAYSLGSAALGHVLLQRYDLVPAALTLFATLSVASGWALLGGILLAVGAGSKLYPALLVPVLAVFAWRHGFRSVVRFAAGIALATLPLLVALFWMPWWRFASYHVDRGLQAESLFASIVWALHFAGVPAGWELVWRTSEVTGPVAGLLVGPGRLLWSTATLASVALAARTAWRLRTARSQPVSVPGMAAVVLLPIAAFVATGNVLSPQFHLWLLPLAALVLSARRGGSKVDGGVAATVPPEALRAAACIVFATFIVPVFYPHRDYATGLGLWRTVVLVLRNGLLLYAAACLWIAVRKMGRTDVPSDQDPPKFMVQ